MSRGKRKDKGRRAPVRRPTKNAGRNKTAESGPLSGQLLQHIRKLYDGKKLTEAAEILRMAETSAASAGEDIKREYLRYYAFVLGNLGQFDKAEKIARQGLDLDLDDPDFYFVLAYVSSNYKEYDRCLEYGHRFLALMEDSKTLTAPEKYLSRGNLHLIHNYLGLACKARNERSQAEEHFRAAIREKPAYNHPYLNLANYYLSRNELSAAENIVNEGLEKCSQVQELLILSKSLKNRATISACLIVKNEEELLPNCLQSIRDVVDEIIVVDTGSTDKTVEIAESYGARVYHQEWTKNFSKHRNFSLSKATSDWLFVIDADEELVAEDIPLLKQAISQNQYRIVSLTVYNMNRETGEYTSFLPSNRLFRREAGFRYNGIVHNQLQFPREETILRVGARLKHYGYSLSPEKMKKKLARSRELLEVQLVERPEDPYVHFNYAQLLRGSSATPDRETTDLIIEHARRAIELSDTDKGGTLHIHLQAHHQLITTYIHLRKYGEAEKLCHHALRLKSDYLDPILSLGHIYAGLNDLDRAEEYFNKYLDFQARYDPSAETVNLILLYVRARHIACYSLGLIKQARKSPLEAESYFLDTLKEQEPYKDTYLRLAAIFLDRREPHRAREYLEKELAWHPDSDLAHLYMAQCLSQENKPEERGKMISKALELTDDKPEVLEKAGCALAEMGQFAPAAGVFQRLVRALPDYPYGKKLLAKALYDSGRFAEALKNYKEYLEMTPDDPEALNDLGNCYFKTEDYAEAERIFERTLSVTDRLAITYRNLGLTKIRLGKPEEALGPFQDYAEVAPDDIDIQLALGVAYSQINQHIKAIPHFEKFLEKNPGHSEALFRISECYLALGYLDSAVIGYQQVLKIDSDFRPARERLQQIQLSHTGV